jgi:tetratricopeptide (TPR) repeat protein
MVSDDSGEPWAAALRDDWGIEHLVQALLLGEGFSFHILSCSTPRADRATLRFLEREVGRRLRILLPSVNKDAGQPFTPEDLFASILEPLIAPLDPAQGPWMLAIDASDVREEDEPAWREVFRRMNERRNGIVRQIEVPLLLCASPRMEVAFAQEAPDFWSIRSTRVEVPLVPAKELPDEEQPAEENAFLRPSFTFEADRVRREITRARQRVEEKPGDRAARAALSIWIERLGRLAVEQSDFQGASTAYEEALSIRSALAGQNPESLQLQADRAASLMDRADVEYMRGSLDRTLSLYEEAQGVMLRLLSRDPDNPEWRTAMARSCHQIGMVTQKRLMREMEA